MARTRQIKPGFFTNEDLVELPFHTRLLFIGLFTIADRDGFLEDRPKRIKMALFPADSFDVDKSLDELARFNFIIRYEVAGTKYIKIVEFKKHQNPHKDEKKSVIPEPTNASIVQAADASIVQAIDASTMQAPCKHDASTASTLKLVTSTLKLVTSTLKPVTCTLEEESAGFEEVYKSTASPKKQKFTKPTKTQIHDFCEDEKIFVDADKFLDHYDANGWMIGRAKMKDWKATARNWARREVEFKNQKTTGMPRASPAQSRAEKNLDACMNFLNPIVTVTEEFYDSERQKTIL